jgi:hypothetical protein
MYQAVLDPAIRSYVEQFVAGHMPSRNQSFEIYKKLDVKRAQWLFRRARYIVATLQREPHWRVALNVKDVLKNEELTINLPHRYEIHIQLGSKGLHQFYLTPAEFTAITLVNADTGRRIGDELDGPKPHS